MPVFSYSNSDFTAFTTIQSSAVNTRFSDLSTFLNTTKLDDTNIQNAGITRATKLKLGTANYVVINDSGGAMSEEATLSTTRGGLGFVPTLTGNGGLAVKVNDAGTAFTLGVPDAAQLTAAFFSDVATFTSAESISANDAVCAALNEGAYKIFKSDSDAGNRKSNHIGFASSIVGSITAGVYTLTKAASWTVGSEIIVINGRTYTQAFTTDNDTSMAALAAQLAADTDVQSAVVTDNGSDDNVITVTGKGARTLTITDSQTGGAPDFTIATATAPVGQSVRVRLFGPMSGFSSLTVGAKYYVSSTAGGITASPNDGAPKFVGTAISSTVLFVNQDVSQFDFPQNILMLKTHGGSTGITAANAQLTVEHYNFNSWSAGTSAGTAVIQTWIGEAFLQSNHYVIDGINTAGAMTNATQVYNKSSWSAGTARGITASGGGIANFDEDELVTWGNSSDAVNTGVDNRLSRWNGSSWANSSVGSSYVNVAGFTGLEDGKVHFAYGSDSGSSTINQHASWNGSSFNGSETAPGETRNGAGGARLQTGLAAAAFSSAGGGANTFVRKWSGSSWSSLTDIGLVNFAVGSSTGNHPGPACGWDSANQKIHLNGGTSAGTTSIATTRTYDGTSFATVTASNTSRSSPQGSVF